MKLIYVFIIILLFSGCKKSNTVGRTSSGEVVYVRECIDGVEYLKNHQGYRGYLAAHWKRDGTLYLCD